MISPFAGPDRPEEATQEVAEQVSDVSKIEAESSGLSLLQTVLPAVPQFKIGRILQEALKTHGTYLYSVTPCAPD